MTIRRVTIRNFKRFREQQFELGDTVVLAGPNNSGKSTLLQAIATWKLALDRWTTRRATGRAAVRSGVPIPRNDITSVPLREMNLLWEERRVTGAKGMSGARRLIEIILEGGSGEGAWSCGMELSYNSREIIYAKPLKAGNADHDALQDFPPEGARTVDVVHVPPLSGIERDEPRRDRGMQDLLIGQGRPGEILRNLLLDVAEREDAADWRAMAGHMRELFRIELQKPVYSPGQPYIICEYRETGGAQPPDISAVGSDMSQGGAKRQRRKGIRLDISSAGSGALQALLLFAFLYARPATVILLDEPDSHQHIILRRQVYDLIRKVARERGAQVIAATHSETILDATAPEQVINFFASSPGILASETERNRMREALKLVSTTDLLLARNAGGILYVESETDHRILLEWARTLDHPAKQYLSNPCVHWLGGRKLAEAKRHFFAMQAVYEDMRGACLLDGDNLEEPDEELTQAGLRVLRWQRYEIENYLLQPDAIKRLVGFPLKNDLIDQAFHQRLIPSGTDLFSDHVALMRTKASSEFIVPLLEEVDFQKPKRDLYQLAAEMTGAEIHPEAVEKLDRIAEIMQLT